MRAAVAARGHGTQHATGALLRTNGSWRTVMDMEKMTTTHMLIASDRVEGTPVRRDNGQKIGTIERVMLDKVSGNVAYAVLTFGGFLGMGQKHMPIPWTRLHYDQKL